MSYRDFTLEQLGKAFDLGIDESNDLFAHVEAVAPGDMLLNYLRRNVPLATAINTEKAKSELIIAPLVFELVRLLPGKVSVFSGVDFTVDTARGLNGVCDFLISRSPQQFYISCPIATIVEAKNDNIKNGLAQCLAEMIAAKMFNEREGTTVACVYGVVTNGNQWKFLSLHNNLVMFDRSDYYINEPGKILGILVHMVLS